MQKFKYPLHYPPLTPHLKEEIELVSGQEMGTVDQRIPILLVTQFGFHYHHVSEKIWINKILAENDEVVSVVFE